MNHIRIFLFLCMLGFTGPGLHAQNARCSGLGSDSDSTYTGAIFANYGSVSNAVNNKYSTSGSLGQSFVGQYFDNQYQGTAGFYSTFLLPPLPPIVTATQGDLLDRIQLNWAMDPLSPATSEGFNIYRDGIFLANVGNGIRTYNDFNVIAGRPYNYTVRGVNTFGEGFAGNALGFQVPNGVVTGWVQTPSGSPVPNALITLTPIQGFSARFGATDGAIADTNGSGMPGMLPGQDEPWTLCFWIKTAQAVDTAGILQFQAAEMLDIRPLAGGQEGVAFAIGGTPLFSGAFPDSTKNDWRHVALSFDGTQYRLYLDGVLTALAPGAALANVYALALGAQTGSPGWEGYLDELRIYHRLLDELDFGEVMDGTASSLTPGLQFYWKMDEEQGIKSFDLIRRSKLYFCGAGFDADRPPVRIAGVTNEQGYYRIESASYGTGTTFLAHPSKYFYKHRALKFVRAENDYAELPDFALPAKATIELWVNSAGPDGEQCLLSKRWGSSSFAVLLQQNGTENNIIFNFDGANLGIPFGQLGMGYQHLALLLESDSINHTVSVFRNGVQQGGSYNFSGPGNFSDTTYHWITGARSTPGGLTDHFGGLIAELAVYDSLLPPALLLEHATADRNPQARGLQVYFPFDEGNGTRLNNIGALLTGPGQAFGTEWTSFAPNQSATPHIFTPDSRQVTLNPSVTSVDQVDFVDRSTVPVSGFVRYKGTDCFAADVEILVNGASFSPPVFTDSTGKFVIDFDPGATATLTPVFADHTFMPAFWDVVNVGTPVAGILFTDLTTRKISGQIAGGECRASIINPDGSDNCQVTVRSRDGCFERIQAIDDPSGEYVFENLPPMELTIAITKHNHPDIYGDFQTQGGRTLDLTLKDSADVDFIYIAPPSVEVEGFEDYTTNCPGPDGDNLVVLAGQEDIVVLTLRVYEQYGQDEAPDERCYLDSADLVIDNTFDLRYNAMQPLEVQLDSSGKYKYKFIVGRPSPDPPHLKLMQITADVNGKKGTYIKRVLVTGILQGQEKFTTQLPVLPNFVLRDPPGDGSYAFIEPGETVCNTLFSEDGGGGGIKYHQDVDVGPETEISLLGLGTITTSIHLNSLQEFETKVIYTSKSSMEYCVTTRERIATDDGDLVVGGVTSFDGGQTLLPGNDVYIGTGFNLIISDSREVTYNDTICQAGLLNVTTAKSDTFATNYMYSEWNIVNNVIRYLDSLILDGNDPDSINSKSKQRWLDFIELNKLTKEHAIYTRNISFDAGVQYEFSETRDTLKKWESWVNEIINGFIAKRLGAKVNDQGIVHTISLTFEGKVTDLGSGGSTHNIVTTGYVLKDDDPGNNWTMDVKDDPMFRTPVFDILAGQTSCPWEVGTAQRHGVSLTSVDGNTRLDVPSNGKAVFHLQLNNNSQTGETFTYALKAEPANNPDGAIIRVNGAPLNAPVYYAIPWGDSVPVTITVERGPVAYSYEGLKIALYSECFYNQAKELGFAPDFDPVQYAAVYLKVEFIEPCSEVDISFPLEGWVVKPDPVNPAFQDILPITISGYDLNDDDLQGIRLQYRPKYGDGAWINIISGNPDYIPKADLGSVFEVYNWNTGGATPLADGEYEIRAVTVCTGGPDDYPGISHIISGRIDRQPPSLVGTPQPSDGVYNVGDEISFTFNKEINCDKLIPADLTQPNNVGLYDATTGQLIDIAVTCYENKITLDPSFDNKFFENHILRAEIHNIPDYTGNRLVYEFWEFYVDRNELAWLTDSIGMTKYEDETKTVIAKIHNRGGYPVPFTITDLPDWVHVVPDMGTLAANEIRDIRFEVDSSLAFGLWTDSITLHTETGQNPFFMGGDEPLPFGVRVVCRPPDWDIDAGLYENTMNMVLKPDIEGVFSIDVEDIVVAYIDDELRGRAYVAYAPEVDDYLVFLTIYGNPDDVGKPIRLEIWDASACLRFGEVQETFQFQPNTVVGLPKTPQLVHTNSLVLRVIPLGYGWNWVSFNLLFPDNSLDAALASLQHPANDLIRAQGPFAVYTGGQWVGSLTALADTTMYIYKTDLPDTIKILGTLIDPLTTSIYLKPGWNWIGYIPNYALPVDDALASLSATPNDLIKSQVAFAIYVDDIYGWVGNLKFLQPPQGYQIKVADAGVLRYPAKPFRPEIIAGRGEADPPPAAYWTVDPGRYEFGMTLIGALEDNGQNVTTATMELGAFAGNEVRGAAQAIPVDTLGTYQFFLTCYANTNGEQLKFKLYDAATGEVWNLAETMYFSADQHQGTIADPVAFTLKSLGTVGSAMALSFDVTPNPFTTEAFIRFTLAHTQDIALTVYDVQGREVSAVRTQAATGLNVLRWSGLSSSGQQLEPGVYLVRLQTDAGVTSKKVVLQR